MNPVHQNYGHIKCLESFICSQRKLPIYSVVIFSEDCNLKVKAEKSFVGYDRDFIDYLRDFTEQVLTESEVKDISEKIKKANISSAENNEQHIKEARDKKEKFEEKITYGICPKCGGKLVERNGKYGKFMGCSNYPRCRFTKNME